MSVMKVLIETEEFLEWMKSEYLRVWEESLEFLCQKIIENCDPARKEIAEFKKTSGMYRRRFLQELEEAIVLVQIAKREAGKENLSKLKNKFNKIRQIFTLEISLDRDLKSRLKREYFDMDLIFSEAGKLIKKSNDYYVVKFSKIINNLKSHVLQRKGFFERLKAKGLLSYFQPLKKEKKFNVVGRKVTLNVSSGLFFRKKLKVEKEEFTYKELLLTLVKKKIEITRDKDKKELYEIYLEELKDKTNNEILSELVEYVYGLCRFILENNPQYILSENFFVHASLQDSGYDGASAFYNIELSTNDTVYITFNAFFLLKNAAENYDFFQGLYSSTNLTFISAVGLITHEFAHARDNHNLVFETKLMNKLENNLKSNHILPQTANLLHFFLNIRDEAISQTSEVFTLTEREQFLKRPRYFVSQQLNSSFGMYKYGFKALMEDVDTSIELLKNEEYVRKNSFDKITIIRYDLARYCAFMIFLYFYFNSQQKKIVTFGKDFSRMNEQIREVLETESKGDKNLYTKLRNNLIFNPENIYSFLTQNKFYLLSKSDVGKCIENDIQFHLYLPDFNFASQFLTALKNMNFVRFFEYYEKACKYFDIPKEKTIFAIKELKDTQKFAEKLHKEEVKRAGFEH